MPEAAGLSEKHFVDSMAHLINILGSGNKMLSLDDILLHDSHPAVVKHIRQSTRESSQSSQPGTRDSWIDKHIQKKGLLHWLETQQSQGQIDILAMSFPGVRTLTRRQLDICNALDIDLPDPQGRIINLSQTLAFTSVNPCSHVGTITPEGQFLLADRIRYSLSFIRSLNSIGCIALCYCCLHICNGVE